MIPPFRTMKTPVLSALLAAALLAGGCATHVRVRTEPAEGAVIRYRGEGRASFRWKTAPTTSPAEFDVYYGRMSVYAYWPATGQRSEKRMLTLSNWRDPDEVVLRPDPSQPPLPRRSSSAVPAGRE